MLDSNEKATKIRELLRKIESHKGKEILDLTRGLAQTEYIVEHNLAEMKAAIQYYELNYMTLWNVDNRPQMIAFMREFSRLLHNYLSSVYTLVEHTRVFLAHVKNAILSFEYEKRKQTLLNDEIISFMQKLRVFGQHYGMSMFSASLDLERVSDLQPILTMNFSKKELLKWNGWSQQAKSYLARQEENIDIKVVTEKYQEEIRGFYKWFHRRLSELYSAEIAQYLAVVGEFQSLSSEPG